MLSVPAVLFLSVSVVRSAFTWVNVPWMTRSFVPVPVIVPPPPVNDVVADRMPWVSLTVTVKISLLVLPLSDTLTPVIAVASLTSNVCSPGTTICGSAATVTSIVCDGALLPKPSFVVTVMLSVPAVLFLSVSVVRSAFTWVNVPWMTRSFVPVPVIVPPPPAADVVADRLAGGCQSAVTVKISLLVLPLSDTLVPVIASV